MKNHMISFAKLKRSITTNRYKIEGPYKWILIFLFTFIQNGIHAQNNTWTQKDSLYYTKTLQKAHEQSNIDLDSSLVYLTDLDSYLKNKNFQEKRIRVLIDKGNVYLLKGMNEKAMQTYLKVEDIAEEIDNEQGKAYAAISIAGLYLQTKEYEKVLELFKNFKKEFVIKDSTEAELKVVSVIYNNEGIAYENLNQFAKAENSYKTSIGIAEKLNDKYNYANSLSNLAIVKSKQGLIEESIALHNKALKIREDNDYKIGISQSLRHLGHDYMLRNDIDSAKQYFKLAMKEAKELNSPKYIQEDAVSLKEIYLKEGDYKKAFEMQEMEIAARAELLNEESLRKETRMKANYENALENKLKEKDQARKETVYYFMFGILVLLVFIATILYLLQKSKTHESYLKNENIEKEKRLLQQDLEYKNKKLVTNLMFLLQKNEMISNLFQKLSEIKKKPKIQSDEIINDVIRELKLHLKGESWDEFETYFQEVHIDFYKKLTEKFNLTPNELRIAAFIKLNLSSKEISSITGQSIRTLDVARYRLRKKLGINNSNTNLHSFLSNI